MFKKILFLILITSCYMSYSQSKKLTLSILPNSLAVCRLDKDAKIPSWVFKSSFYTVSKNADELSVVCDQSVVPGDVKKTENWKAFKVQGPLDFSQIGIISSLSKPLAENNIPIFAISTYDTDYILVESKYFTQAKSVLATICIVKE
jgi:hypothetical protein